MKRSVLSGAALMAVAACTTTEVALDLPSSPPGLHNGTYLVTGAVLPPDACNIGSFYGSISTAGLVIPGKRGSSSADITEGGFGPYTYDIAGQTLSDLPDSSTSVQNCSTANGGGNPGYQCGTLNPYPCKMIFSITFLGSIDSEDRFTLTDVYSWTQGSPACPPAVINSARGNAVFPCVSVDKGDFTKS